MSPFGAAAAALLAAARRIHASARRPTQRRCMAGTCGRADRGCWPTTRQAAAWAACTWGTAPQQLRAALARWPVAAALALAAARQQRAAPAVRQRDCRHARARPFPRRTDSLPKRVSHTATKQQRTARVRPAFRPGALNELVRWRDGHVAGREPELEHAEARAQRARVGGYADFARVGRHEHSRARARAPRRALHVVAGPVLRALDGDGLPARSALAHRCLLHAGGQRAPWLGATKTGQLANVLHVASIHLRCWRAGGWAVSCD